MNAWEGFYEGEKIGRLKAFYISCSLGGGINKPEDMYWLWGDPLPPKPKTKEEIDQLTAKAKEKWKAQV